MLLIRPLLQTNRERKHVTHTVVFFIFLVSNIGGCLTPLGDPPALPRVPAAAFRSRGRSGCSCRGSSPRRLVLAVYVLWDRRAHAREGRADLRAGLLRGAAASVSAARRTWSSSSASWPRWPSCESPGGRWRSSALAALSFARTDPALRAGQPASPSTRSSRWPRSSPGIFVTMLPAIDLLQARGAELGVTRALAVLLGDRRPELLPGQRADVPDLPRPRPGAGAAGRGGRSAALRSWSRSASARCSWAPTPTSATGRTSWSARSPRSAGVRMPSFGGYMLYSGAVLLPISWW